jgi:hypothetical protein
MRNKRGWIRILEATIAVMIVSSVLIVVYSKQVDRGESETDFFYGVQQGLLADIWSRNDLRLNVLNTVEDNSGDGNFVVLDNHIAGKVSDSFGYLLRVCELGGDIDGCAMDDGTYIATLDKSVFVEEVVISSELGSGEGAQIYNPKRVRLFMWEGGFPEGYCKNECTLGDSVSICSNDSLSVLTKACGEFDSDDCLEYNNFTETEVCGVDEFCEEGECLEEEDEEPIGGFEIWTCRMNTNSGCGSHTSVCGSGEGEAIEDCGGIFSSDTWYQCYDIKTTECSETPTCPAGFYKVGQVDCEPPKVSALSLVFSDVVYEKIGVDHYYYHTRTFTESGGVGVTLNEGEVCPESIGCKGRVSIDYRIGANDKLIHLNKQFNTNQPSNKFVLKYWGVSDNGDNVYVEQSLCVQGSSFFINC